MVVFHFTYIVYFIFFITALRMCVQTKSPAGPAGRSVSYVQCVYYICDPDTTWRYGRDRHAQSGLARERGGPTRDRSTSAGGGGGEGGRWNFGNVCRPRRCQGRPTKVIQWSRSGPGSQPGPVRAGVGKRGAESGIAPEAWGDMAGVKADGP